MPKLISKQFSIITTLFHSNYLKFSESSKTYTSSVLWQKRCILSSFNSFGQNLISPNVVLTKITYKNELKIVWNCKIDYFCNPNDILSNFMSLIDEIRKPIANEMQIFKSIFAESLRSDNPLLSSINDYVLQGSGKQLRPILTILSSKLLGNVTDATYNGALSLELLHNASLIDRKSVV